jgi:hypothetical protein
MPDRGAPEAAVVHRFSLRFLMFNPPDQLVFCFAQRAGEVRVISDRYERRKTGQTRSQCDALPLAAAIL